MKVVIRVMLMLKLFIDLNQTEIYSQLNTKQQLIKTHQSI